MVINLNYLTHVIHACFILHNFCKIKDESISQKEVDATMKYVSEFQSPRQSGYDLSTNNIGGKKVVQTFVEIFWESINDH